MQSLPLVFAGNLGFANGAAAEVTFDDVMPLLRKHCLESHRTGQIAPMSFLAYEETRPWAESIKENVAQAGFGGNADRGHRTLRQLQEESLQSRPVGHSLMGGSDEGRDDDWRARLHRRRWRDERLTPGLSTRERR